MRKRFGQHFLTDAGAAESIVAAADLSRDDYVLEIGPGRGALTGLIAERAREVAAVEIDRGLCGLLERKFSSAGNVRILNADFLDIQFGELFPGLPGAPRGAVKVIGNIPYYITAPILARLFGWKEFLGGIVLTVQKEVAERMAAHPGSRIYGALSVFVQFNSRVRILMPVGRACFTPPPEVDSAAVMIELFGEPPFEVGDAQMFSGFVKSMFASRRKMAHNALASAAGIEKDEARVFLSDAGIFHKKRPEALSVEDYARLFNIVREGS